MEENNKISYDDYKKVEMKVGEILSAEKVLDTDKLIRLSVNFSESLPRQIVSGISMHFPDPQVLVGKKVMFVTNIPPRTIHGLESNGMILAVGGDGESFSLLEVSKDIPAGQSAR